MKILMTGGTGFIGGNLIKKFKGCHFTILTRDVELVKKSLGNNQLYLTKISQISTDIKFDVIINFAGEPIAKKKWTKQQKKELEDSRWNITQELVDWIKTAKHKPDCFLSGSAIGFYGTSETKTFTENHIREAQDFSSHLCQKWEDIAMTVSDITRVVLLRTGIVLAPEGGVLKKMALPFKLGLGGKLGSGNQWMSWIHIDDYLNALKHLIDDETCYGAYNLTSPNPIKNSDFSKALAISLNRPAFISVPSFVLKTVLGEASTIVLDGQKVIPQKLINNNFSFIFENCRDAIDDLLMDNEGSEI